MKISDIADKMVKMAWAKHKVDRNLKITFEETYERLNERKSQGDSSDYHEIFYHKTKHLNRPINLGGIDSRLLLIYEIMKHVPMSPSRKDDHDIIYTIMEKDGQIEFLDMVFDNEYPETMNKDMNMLSSIFIYWIDRAKDLISRPDLSDEYVKPIGKFVNCLYMITGRPGVGKSATINYLFSYYGNQMIDENVMFVRVDMNKVFGKAEKLRKMLLTKYLYIITRFYLYNEDRGFGLSRMDDIMNDLIIFVSSEPYFKQAFSDSTPNEVAKSFIKGLAGCNLLLNKDNKSADKNDYNGSKHAGKSILLEYFDMDDQTIYLMIEWLMSYIQTNYNYAYIFVFDGFDNVTFNYSQERRFLSWLKEFDSIVSNNLKLYSAVYIATMRDYSYIKYKRDNGGHEGSRANENIVNLKIERQPMWEIIQKRVNYAEFRAKKIDLDILRDEAINISRNLLRIIYIAMNPNGDIVREGASIEYLVDHFHRVNADNFRAALRIYRALIIVVADILGLDMYNELCKDELEKDTVLRIERAKWKIIKLMLYGTTGYRTYRNCIQFKPSGETPKNDLIVKKDMITIDHNRKSVIPNIFNCREHIYSESNRWPKNLFKIRIIQILRINNGVGNVLSVERWFRDILDYQTKDIRFEIREMIYTGLLLPSYLEIDVDEQENELGDYTVRLSETANLIMETMLNKYVYYETVVDDTPLPYQYSNYIIPINADEPGIGIDDYLCDKTKAVLIFLKYLMDIEKIEKPLIIDMMCNNEEDIFKANWEIFTDKRVDLILKQMDNSIFKYMSKKTRKDVYDMVEKWNFTHKISIYI